jgi:hypothetical protein
MFDEHTLSTILVQHFPDAASADIADAARDLLLFDLLADDRVPVWEDAMGDGAHRAPVQGFATSRSIES